MPVVCPGWGVLRLEIDWYIMNGRRSTRSTRESCPVLTQHIPKPKKFLSNTLPDQIYDQTQKERYHYPQVPH